MFVPSKAMDIDNEHVTSTDASTLAIVSSDVKLQQRCFVKLVRIPDVKQEQQSHSKGINRTEVYNYV